MGCRWPAKTLGGDNFLNFQGRLLQKAPACPGRKRNFPPEAAQGQKWENGNACLPACLT